MDDLFEHQLKLFILKLRGITTGQSLLDAYSEVVAQFEDKDYLEFPLRQASSQISTRQLRDLKEKMVIHLRQYFDYRWYKDHPVYHNDVALEKDHACWPLTKLKQHYSLHFQYRPLKKGPFGRHQNAIRKRLDTINRNPGASTIGMKTVSSRLEIMALINEMNEKIVQAYGEPLNLQINSIIRTTEHQQQLIDIGYNATLFSAHCVGYAIDIERRWYAIHNKTLFHCIDQVLIDYHEKGIINLIDERIVWHLCLNPDYIEYYKAKAENWKTK